MKRIHTFLGVWLVAAGVSACKPSGPAEPEPEQEKTVPGPRPVVPADVARPPAGVQPTRSGIYSRLLEPGTGTRHPSPSNVVVFHFSSWSASGELLDTSIVRGKPVTSPLGRTHPGWVEAIGQMVAGEKRRFWIPPELFEGPYASRKDLIVTDVDLIDVRALNTEAELTKEQKEVVEEFNRLYAETHIESRNITWMGVEIQQNPCDCWVMQEIIWELKPDFIIETGTYAGGSALYFASILERANPERGKVITVDKYPMVGAVSKHDVFRERVEVIKGDSVSPEVLRRIAERIEGAKTVLVTLDSLHTREHVLKELHNYARFVSRGSYLVVQDTKIRNFFPGFGPGPGEAVKEFLVSRTGFVRDKSREKLLLTYYAGGYLKRID